MPRDDEWEMSDQTRAQLHEQITSEMFGQISDPQSPADVRAMQDRYGKENLTAWLAGTRDKSSRAWKSARDGLSRRRTGRGGIGKLWRDKFRTAQRRAQSDRVRSRGSLSVTLTADVLVSSRWDYGRPMYASLSGGELEDYLAALEAGNLEQAAMVVAESYGLPEIVSIENVSGFDSDLAELDADEDDQE